MQLPLFALSLFLTTYNLRYVTPVSFCRKLRNNFLISISLQGKAKSTKDVLTRIDWGGSFTLLMAVRGCLTLKLFEQTYSYSNDRSALS